jgi:hypothetical protein
MLLFQIAATIVRLFVGSFLALVLFPAWILIFVLTCPLRIISPSVHAELGNWFFGLFLKIVFLDFKR